jgi:hypothetical protein
LVGVVVGARSVGVFKLTALPGATIPAGLAVLLGVLIGVKNGGGVSTVTIVVVAVFVIVMPFSPVTPEAGTVIAGIEVKFGVVVAFKVLSTFGITKPRYASIKAAATINSTKSNGIKLGM